MPVVPGTTRSVSFFFFCSNLSFLFDSSLRRLFCLFFQAGFISFSKDVISARVIIPRISPDLPPFNSNGDKYNVLFGPLLLLREPLLPTGCYLCYSVNFCCINFYKNLSWRIYIEYGYFENICPSNPFILENFNIFPIAVHGFYRISP